jgi:hypothetical protein
MSTPRHTQQLSPADAYQEIERSMRTLDLAALSGDKALLPVTQKERVQRVLNVYRSVRPFLMAITTLALIPKKWRTAISIFVQALEALSNAEPSKQSGFKAGKDL